MDITSPSNSFLYNLSISGVVEFPIRISLFYRQFINYIEYEREYIIIIIMSLLLLSLLLLSPLLWFHYFNLL